MSKFKGFTSVELRSPKKSQFDLSHQKRVSSRMGRLFPVMCVETMPGDSFKGGSEILLRLAPLLAPIYDSIQLFVHFFFVPNRLLWEDWEEFITGGRLGVGIDPVTAPVPPFVDIGAVYASADWSIFSKSSLADYLGVPDLLVFDPATPEVSWDGINLDVMPFQAYQLVWYEYYRDRNFHSDEDGTVGQLLASGEYPADDFENYLGNLRTRDYLKEYFTSALPFVQRGQEVLIPVESEVTYKPTSEIFSTAGSSPANANALLGANTGGAGSLFQKQNLTDTTGPASRIENIDSISNVSATINDFRAAYALQVWLERNAVAGSRYTETLQAHFDVKPQDSRLQRPEFLGGGRIRVKISEVVTTAWSQDDAAADVPVGNMGGHGVTYGNTNNFRYFCYEHGFIMGIASIMCEPSYHQGMPRMFYKRRSFLDYPWPTFAKLGEQVVDKAELYSSPANLTPDVDGEFPLFGYQSRYADWKYVPNTNHGDFHDTLLFWTLTRQFATSPELGETFVRFDDTTQDRIFAVNGSADNFWMYAHNRLSVVRSLPYYGVPNTLGFV